MVVRSREALIGEGGEGQAAEGAARRHCGRRRGKNGGRGSAAKGHSKTRVCACTNARAEVLGPSDASDE